MKGVSEFMTNHIVDQVWTGPHEVNVERYIPARRIAAPSLGHVADD
jgi:hypothetical protein